jgi:hypothetical protein
MLCPDNALKSTTNLYVGVDLPPAKTSLSLIDGQPLSGRHLGLTGPPKIRLSLNKEPSEEMRDNTGVPGYIEGLRECEIDAILYEWTPENLGLVFESQSVLLVYTQTVYGYMLLYDAEVISDFDVEIAKTKFTELPMLFGAKGVSSRPEGDQIGQIKFPSGHIRYI